MEVDTETVVPPAPAAEGMEVDEKAVEITTQESKPQAETIYVHNLNEKVQVTGVYSYSTLSITISSACPILQYSNKPSRTSSNPTGKSSVSPPTITCGCGGRLLSPWTRSRTLRKRWTNWKDSRSTASPSSVLNPASPQVDALIYSQQAEFAKVPSDTVVKRKSPEELETHKAERVKNKSRLQFPACAHNIESQSAELTRRNNPYNKKVVLRKEVAKKGM